MSNLASFHRQTGRQTEPLQLSELVAQLPKERAWGCPSRHARVDDESGVLLQLDWATGRGDNVTVTSCGTL
jgi:hypothetical protein